MSDIKHTDLPWKKSHFGEVLGPDDQDGDDTVIGCIGTSNVARSAIHSIVKGVESGGNLDLIILACNSYYESQAKIASQEEAIRELVEVIRVTTEALEQITKFGGNISDESLMTRTGPNDAEARGVMYVNAREVANEAIAKAGSAVE
ncbi:MAG: hypothetical protein GY941_05210 [Planctomycetes bacterium]|nr:hypothetical protein [Planctomycetota bacterium]